MKKVLVGLVMSTCLLVASSLYAGDNQIQIMLEVQDLTVYGFTPATLTLDLELGKTELMQINAMAQSAERNFQLYWGTGRIFSNGNLNLTVTNGRVVMRISLDSPRYDGTIRATNADPDAAVVDEGTVSFVDLL